MRSRAAHCCAVHWPGHSAVMRRGARRAAALRRSDRGAALRTLVHDMPAAGESGPQGPGPGDSAASSVYLLGRLGFEPTSSIDDVDGHRTHCSWPGRDVPTSDASFTTSTHMHHDGHVMIMGTIESHAAAAARGARIAIARARARAMHCSMQLASAAAHACCSCSCSITIAIAIDYRARGARARDREIDRDVYSALEI